MIKNWRAWLFYITLFLFIVLASFQTNFVDYDLFARLLQGKAFWSLGNVLHHDIFSYTPTHTWYDHEWGSSVIFYPVLKYFGPIGLLWLKSILIFGIFFFIIQTIKLKGVTLTTPYNFLIYYFAYITTRNSGYANTIRCMLFTYLFFVIWLYLLERVRVKKENYWLATFIPMMLFWSNIHGGCAAGFGLVVLYAVGEAISKKPFKHYIFTLLGCALITLVNPWGIGYVEFLIMATTMPRTLIAEWQPTFGALNVHNYLMFKIWFVLALFVLIVYLVKALKSKEKLDYTKLIVMTVMTYLSVKFTRHQPLFVICSLVFLYDDFYSICLPMVKKLIKSDVLRQKLDVGKEILMFLLVALATCGYFAINKPQIVISNSVYPIRAIEFVKINKLRGNILVDFELGSYTAYKLFPYNLIAMDGRYEEVYPDYMLPMLNNFFMQATDNPNQLINEFRPDIIIVSHKMKSDESLSMDKSYEKAYSDETFSLYLDKNLAHKDYKQPTKDAEYYNKTLFDSTLKFSKPKK